MESSLKRNGLIWFYRSFCGEIFLQHFHQIPKFLISFLRGFDRFLQVCALTFLLNMLYFFQQGLIGSLVKTAAFFFRMFFLSSQLRLHLLKHFRSFVFVGVPEVPEYLMASEAVYNSSRDRISANVCSSFIKILNCFQSIAFWKSLTAIFPIRDIELRLW